jgi:hypothetical protein
MGLGWVGGYPQFGSKPAGSGSEGTCQLANEKEI